MDRGPWWATVHGVTKSQTWPSDLATTKGACWKHTSARLTLSPRSNQKDVMKKEVLLAGLLSWCPGGNSDLDNHTRGPTSEGEELSCPSQASVLSFPIYKSGSLMVLSGSVRSLPAPQGLPLLAGTPWASFPSPLSHWQQRRWHIKLYGHPCLRHFRFGSHHSLLADLVTLLQGMPGRCIPASPLQRPHHFPSHPFLFGLYGVWGLLGFTSSLSKQVNSPFLCLPLRLAARLFAEVSAFSLGVEGSHHVWGPPGQHLKREPPHERPVDRKPGTSLRTCLLCSKMPPFTGAGCHSLRHGIFLTQGLNPGLLHYRQIIYRLSHQGSPHLGWGR